METNRKLFSGKFDLSSLQVSQLEPNIDLVIFNIKGTKCDLQCILYLQHRLEPSLKIYTTVELQSSSILHYHGLLFDA